MKTVRLIKIHEMQESRNIELKGVLTSSEQRSRMNSSEIQPGLRKASEKMSHSALRKPSERISHSALRKPSEKIVPQLATALQDARKSIKRKNKKAKGTIIQQKNINHGSPSQKTKKLSSTLKIRSPVKRTIIHAEHFSTKLKK